MHTRGLGCEGEVTKCTQEGLGSRVRLQNAHERVGVRG